MAQSWDAELTGAGAFRAGLAYYSPDLGQSVHAHGAPHVSVVVAGSFRETTSQGERTVCQGSVGFRADAARHSVRFGPSGALILTVALDDWIADGAPEDGIRWLSASAPFAREMLKLAKEGGEAERIEVADRLYDLWAGGARLDGRVHRQPPIWLREAAERLLVAPDVHSVSGLARRAGVHRVHFARQFLRYYGMAPSVFRRRAMASRALSSALRQDVNLAGAAAEAGFADQSHMSRAMKEWCVMGAGEMRRLFLADATSVQASARAAAQ